MSPSGINTPPTSKQLRYLRSLAEKTATTFTHPHSRGQASAEIARMKQLKQSDQTSLLDDIHTDEEPLVYATAVQPGEVSGFGSGASWRTGGSAPPVLTPPRVTVGERTELARYSISTGQRVLYGQRINGCVRVIDRPASGAGRSYLIERELEQDGYSALKALVADYVQHAGKLDQIPMASSLIRRELEQLTSSL